MRGVAQDLTAVKQQSWDRLAHAVSVHSSASPSPQIPLQTPQTQKEIMTHLELGSEFLDFF